MTIPKVNCNRHRQNEASCSCF